MAKLILKISNSTKKRNSKNSLKKVQIVKMKTWPRFSKSIFQKIAQYPNKQKYPECLIPYNCAINTRKSGADKCCNDQNLRTYLSKSMVSAILKILHQIQI